MAIRLINHRHKLKQLFLLIVLFDNDVLYGILALQHAKNPVVRKACIPVLQTIIPCIVLCQGALSAVSKNRQAGIIELVHFSIK